MENYKLNYNNDAEILRCIKEEILNIHPVVENRLNILMPLLSNPPTPEMEIEFRFLKINDEDITQILFVDGTYNYKKSIPGYITINGLVSKKVICDLISYLLTDHDYFKNINKGINNFHITMDVDCRNDNMHGISCGEIDLQFDFYRHPDKKVLLNEYLKTIATTFYEQLKEIGAVKQEFSAYCDIVKKEFINSLTDKELKQFIDLLNNEDLCNLILSMPNNRFIELYNEYIKQEDEKKLIKY